ncbi:MAG: trigger factor [Candidatus Babeliales bacterium]
MTHPIKCSIKEENPQFCHLTVDIPCPIVNELYQEIALAQKSEIQTVGFSKYSTPLSYIQQHYKNSITDHIKEFLFKFFLINYLQEFLHQKKLRLFGEPRILDIHVEPEQDAIFEFELSLSKPIDFREWKSFPFKAPKRKNYKDIDRQVESFIKQEHDAKKQITDENITVGDWVCFDIGLCSASNIPLLNNHHESAWIKIGSEEADIPFQELFVGKKRGDSFCTDHHCLQEYFSTSINTRYNFSLSIQEIVPHAYFCFDDFKHHFRLKSNKDVHEKLIEIFSYRDDLSQRRGIVEEALKLLISKHHIETPHYLILRQQKLVLEAVQSNPDYQVYKTEPTFKDFIRQLATKQVREMILIDQLAVDENIKINNQDLKAYLNLLKRARTKEFIYFTPPPTKIEGQEMPIPSGLLKRTCLREKTLNHVIHHLTRK